ncbi:dienelactone hydrolase family protein [Aureibaculum marinum]|uniref:Dienelactone hydrolase family protein n=1 Tax=Aureibaculum marinum TaxID=2487930 RepID=A0A3N4NR33_9FLAO|nr:dienelactone hydrolase family protein [Aureibaculum marinum]RPD98684.1 dienelactone hydrolase family protein [Aureibaculum marinum]
MKNINKEDIKQEVFDLYDSYVHNKIDRRNFMNKLSVYAVGGLTLPSLLAFLMPKYTEAQQIKFNDPRLTSEYVEYDSPNGAGKMRGLLTRPINNSKKLGGIIVVHENRGLNPHIEDVARKAALEGFIAFAPDALFPLGGYPGSDDEGRELQRKRDRNEMLEDFISAYNFLKIHKECSGNVGVVGFCFGGLISNNMAVHIPDLKASVPFYGGQAATEDVPKIKAPLLLHFAELDKRVNTGWPTYEAALKKHKKEYTAYIYKGTNHGFHNDTTPRYDETAAKLAWSRTIAFFKEKLV